MIGQSVELKKVGAMQAHELLVMVTECPQQEWIPKGYNPSLKNTPEKEEGADNNN